MTKKIIFILLCFSSVALGTYIGLNDGSGGLLLPDRTKPVWTVDSETPVEEPNLDYDPNWPYGIGIPTPPFGIDETYRMYDDVNNQNSELTYNPSDSGGYYTHYIDSSTGTNTGRAFGTKDAPRASIPQNLPAGSIVEIHNSFLQNGYGECCISGVGTADMPIFIRGIDMPRTESPMSLGYYGNAKYLIVDGLSFPVLQIVGRQDGVTFENSYISIRNCDFTAKLVPDGSGIKGIISTWTSNSVSNIVIYNNTFHDQGQWDPALAEGDHDYHGVSCSTGHYIWFLDNTFYHLEGDGVQVGGTSSGVHHVYVGGNTAHHNKQSGFWTKTASDVIFSQNTVYGMRTSTSAPGPGLGLQYDPNNVWFLFNKVYDCTSGITTLGVNAGGNRDDIHFIGNLVYDCNQGMQINELTEDTSLIAYNTFYNCLQPIQNGYGAGHVIHTNIVNNIFANYTSAIDPGDGDMFNHSTFDYDLVDNSGNIIWDATYANLAALIAGTTQGDHAVAGDPNFVDAENGDFDLQSGSPFKSISESSEVQTVIDRFNTLYGIDISDEVRSLRLTGVQKAP